jgi:flagellar M-ring protein FliF
MNAVVQSMQQIGSGRVISLSILGVALLLGFAFLSMRLSEPVLSPLYTNLTPDDSGSIVTELGGMGIKFNVTQGGSAIMVPSPDVLKVRMTLAQKGLPSHGSIVGYEIFDKEAALGTSSFVLNVNMLRALEGELSRTIGSMSSIKSARVHLVVPKRELFRKNKIEPSASVILKLNNRTIIPKKEIISVKHLVGSAVPGLKPKNITIVDGMGRLLSRGGVEDDEGGSMNASTSEEFRTNYESRLRNKIETLLEQAVGFGSVKVRVNAEMTFDRITTSSETYDPEGKVARSVQTSEEVNNSKDSKGGEVSAGTNLPGASAESAGGSATSAERLNEVTNYEISKTLTNKISNVGDIKQISIAVLVDGSYTRVTDEESGEVTEIYNPRTEEEIEQLKTLVRLSVGLDKKRGDNIDIINMKFTRSIGTMIEDEGPFDWIKRDLNSIIKTLMVGIVAILAILLVIRPLVNRAFEISPTDIEAEVAKASLDGQSMAQMPLAAMGGGAGFPAGGGDQTAAAIGMDNIQSRVDTSPTKRVNDLVENNPEETLSVIRSWLSENGQ